MAEFQLIPTDRLVDPELPIRKDITPETVQDLVESIKQVGIIEPLIVRKMGEYFEVIAGHRRLVAAREAKLAQVPCVIRKVDDMKSELIKLHENLARKEISPVQWSNHLIEMKNKYNLTNTQLAETLGRSEAWISQHLDIVKYPPILLEALDRGAIAFTAARELNSIRDPKAKEVYIQHAIRGGVTPTLAATWRKQANRDPQELHQVPEDPIPSTPQDLSAPELPLCPICGEEMAYHEQVTVTVHARCQPQPVEEVPASQ